ncbi:hypothetical protein AO381_0090 [Moraxella catarrhalis]|nr:hypothetical protein AO381_0090 [Moraxella catarrhalis]
MIIIYFNQKSSIRWAFLVITTVKMTAFMTLWAYWLINPKNPLASCPKFRHDGVTK